MSDMDPGTDGRNGDTALSEVGFDPDQSAAHLLHRAQQVAADLHISAFGAAGLTQRQLTVLAAVGARDRASQTELVGATGIDRSTLAEMITRMASRGLVARERSQTDTRANEVRLTAEGRAALDAAIPRLRAVDEAVLSGLPGSKRQQFLSLLQRLVFQEAGDEGEADTRKPKKPKKDKRQKKDKKAKKGRSRQADAATAGPGT